MSDTIREDMTLGHLAQMLERWGVGLSAERTAGRLDVAVQGPGGPCSFRVQHPADTTLGPAIVRTLRAYRDNVRKGAE